MVDLMNFSPVEEFLAKWICQCLDADPETPTYVVMSLPKNGEHQSTHRIQAKPRTKAEVEVLPTPEIGSWTYDRGDAPLPRWQAFIVQAREDTQHDASP